MKLIRILILLVIFSGVNLINAQEIPVKQVIKSADLANFLKEDVKAALQVNGQISSASLAQYFRVQFSHRYFYDWKSFEQRFQTYQKLYPESKVGHTERALDHMSKYVDSTQWKLPFNYLFGEPVNAYAIRHLARQHKMVDIAFYYHYQQQNPNYLNYFKNQLSSLNFALHNNNFETIEDGNGVYEAFRSGYRVLNWLQIHNMFLGQSSYTDEDQLVTIATLLQHGAHLYAHNTKFVPGNHQTRGMSALAMLSILFRDFKGTDEWYQRSMKLLAEHLAEEVNEDGFQSERSVHYHISDIENYFYVYQLAKNSNIKVDPYWEDKLKSLFTTLTKIAYPDKSAPVLQDDTDIPWAEKNDISEALTLGYLLFEDPTLGYFSAPNVEAKLYWYISKQQLAQLNNIKKIPPSFKSVSFPTTGYYIMREGWEPNQKMLIISAGLDEEKPDHQHGDMLGIQAMAHGKVLLPNYQVRYFLTDLELFKNSMVKNVALVDDQLQGKKYSGNQGGSGFGKFKVFPNPKVIGWLSDENNEVFIGSHDGFENIRVNYSRQVINVNNDFWLVKDNFKSDEKHTYKQVWQGHYTLEHQPNLLRATFDDASGFDIYQLVKTDEVTSSGARGKQWSVVAKNEATDFSFITVLFPYKGFDKRIDEMANNPNFKEWKQQNKMYNAEGENLITLSKNKEAYFFGVKKLSYKNTIIELSSISDVYVNEVNNELVIQLLSDQTIQLNVVSPVLKKTKPITTLSQLKPIEVLKIKL